MEIQYKTAYGPKLKLATINDKPSMTKQSLKDDADVNKIIKRYNKTGVLPNMNKLEAIYGEITSQDLQDALNKVDQSYEAFQEVPADIRAQFSNDAGAFIDYATNPANIDQMRAWKLAPTPPEPTPTPEPTSEPTPEPTPAP
jgi:phage internal scaffolding protein